MTEQQQGREQYRQQEAYRELPAGERESGTGREQDLELRKKRTAHSFSGYVVSVNPAGGFPLQDTSDLLYEIRTATGG